ncbi:hypothetical protein COT72_01190 [archaeon CG10_big_fil_rev_8_21_14_0_10_43_11]|nr:MAG: hypothetical protein COT72_01190 [archaeon CG10_big_fil_rev_8_21_14_0_10_43_11]
MNKPLLSYKRKTLADQLSEWDQKTPVLDHFFKEGKNQHSNESRTVLLMSQYRDGVMVSADSMTSAGFRQATLSSQKVSYLNPLVISAGTGYVYPLYEIEAITQRASAKEMAFRQISLGLDNPKSIPRVEELAEFSSSVFKKLAYFYPMHLGVLLMGGMNAENQPALYSSESPGAMFHFNNVFDRHAAGAHDAPLLFAVDGCGYNETGKEIRDLTEDDTSFFKYKTRNSFTREKSLIAHLKATTASFKDKDGSTQGVGGNVYLAYIHNNNGRFEPHFDVFDYKKITTWKDEFNTLELLIKKDEAIDNVEGIGDINAFIDSLRAEYNGTTLQYNGEHNHFSAPFTPFYRVQAFKPDTHRLNTIFDIKIPHSTMKFSVSKTGSDSFDSAAFGNVYGKALGALRQGETPFEQSSMLAFKFNSTPDPVEQNSLFKTLPSVGLFRLDPPHLRNYEHATILNFDYGEVGFGSFYVTGMHKLLSRTPEILVNQLFIDHALSDITRNLPLRANIEENFPVLESHLRYYLEFDSADFLQDKSSAYVGIIGEIQNDATINLWESSPLGVGFRKTNDALAIMPEQAHASKLEELMVKHVVNNEQSNQDDIALTKGLAYFVQAHYHGHALRSYDKISKDLNTRLSIRVPAFNRASYNSVVQQKKKEWFIDRSLKYLKSVTKR